MEPSNVYSSAVKISPITCSKGGDHDGEVITLVCLQPGCKFAVCCSVCLSEHHSHRTESIKIRLRNAQESMNGLNGKDTDASMLADTIQQCRREMKVSVDNVRRSVNSSLQEIDSLIDHQFEIMEERLRLLKSFGEELSSVIGNARTAEDLVDLMDRISKLSTMTKPSGNEPYPVLADGIISRKEQIVRLTTELLSSTVLKSDAIRIVLRDLSNLDTKKKILYCDSNHILQECSKLPFPGYDQGQYICNRCDRQETASAQKPVFHCDLCQYDLCQRCADKKRTV